MDTEITLVSVCGPNRDEPQFYERLQEQQTERQNLHIELAGVWNLVLDSSLDYCSYERVNNPKVREKASEMTTEFNLTDVGREIHPEALRFIWRR